MKTICVCTTVHPAWDVRVFEKEILTLLQKYRVIYVAPEDNYLPENLPPHFTYFPLKKSCHRFWRIFRSLFVFNALFSLRKRISSYHVHDPELSIVLVLLKIFTQRYCIYDVHENYAAAIKERFWIPVPFRKLLSFIFSITEKFSLLFFDAIICSSLKIYQLYKHRNKILLENYPNKTHYQSILPFTQKKPQILLAGSLTRVRGVVQTVQAFIRANLPREFRLILLGWFESEELKQTVLEMLKASNKKNNFQYISWLPYRESLKYLKQSAIGIIPYLDYENHRFGFPNKIYEFMATGTPFIYNRLPNYLRVVGKHHVGLAVDCSNPQEIAIAMEKLAHNPDLRRQMGKVGRELFLNKFNWEKQEHALLQLYENIE